MEKPPESAPQGTEQRPVRSRIGAPVVWLMLGLILVLGYLFIYRDYARKDRIEYGFFKQLLKEGRVEQVTAGGPHGLRYHGRFKDPPPTHPDRQGKDGQPLQLKTEFFVDIPPKSDDAELERLLQSVGRRYDAEEISDGAAAYMMMYLLVTLLLFGGVWMMWRRTRDQLFGGTGFLSGFAKSPAKKYEAGSKVVTFKDVAGLESVKQDLQEIVDFLKSPEKFHRLGGRIPKGVLLVGPPGTGKTLLARAVAGEAGVRFYSVNGSEFIQMFVGVGASRVRDLFKNAKDDAPCILFIDEIDAVGRIRGAGLGGGHDEREQTLNQILSEMDGFSQTEAVIVMAATNRPDVLDPALLRPGRFDRHITVDRPTRKGRAAIFKVHTRDVPLADDVDLDRLAAGTVGLTGADIANLVNEAALWATRHGKDRVSMDDFEYARDKVLMGPKREDLVSEREKKITAYHEAGHALLAWLLPGADPVHKVTIIPRGRTLGVTQLLPEEDRMNIGESNLHTLLAITLGGRSAEKLVFNELSAGAENDLQQATKIARRMVTHWGMSERVGPVAYRTSEEHPFLGKELHEQREFSEYTAQIIDEEVAAILRKAADRAMQVQTEHRNDLDKLAQALIDNEEIDEQDMERLIGPSVNQVARGNGRAAAGLGAKVVSG